MWYLIYISADVKLHKNVESEKGSFISDLQPLLEPIPWLLPKMAQVKPHLHMVYHISSGPVFHVDSGYEAQIQVFHLCDVL